MIQEKMTIAEYRKMINKPVNTNKYRNIKTVVDGITFESKAEANRYLELKMLLRAGEISHLRLQPRFVLQEPIKGKCRGITYIADFEYHESASDAVVVEDVKGVETEAFRIKKKLFLERYPEYELRIVKR